MASKRLGFKPTVADQKRMSLAASRFYASMAPDAKADSAAAQIAAQAAGIKPKQERAAPRQLEAPVVAAISELLAVHPLVCFAVRQNTGSASYEAASGKWAPVNFYNHVTHSKKDITIVDFWGFLKDGRMLAVEAKKPGWTKPTDEREVRQANFLMLVRNCGGVALFATSAEDVASALQ